MRYLNFAHVNPNSEIGRRPTISYEIRAWIRATSAGRYSRFKVCLLKFNIYILISKANNLYDAVSTAVQRQFILNHINYMLKYFAV